MKRYCQTLKLKNNRKLISSYVAVHKEVWSEIQQGIKEVEILDMQIYIHDNLLFMIVDTVDDFVWDLDMARLALLPRQAEWEKYVARFQEVEEDASSKEKWVLMDRIFSLNK